MESAAQALAVGTRVGEYEVTGQLGAGAMGTVYAGVHPVIGKRVAIKVLNAQLASSQRMVDRFVQEARAVVKIQHRNIIDVFAFGRADGVGHYFVMPLLDGQSLGERVADGGPMTLTEALPVVEQIAAALDAAHEQSIFHRDLKPDNVFLVRERDGVASVRVLDFGIAKLLDGDVSTTQTGVQMGTPLFMSPEQWDGAGVDHRTDVYALGVLVHHLLTGRYPFESNSPVALMNMHANQEPMLPSAYGADAAIDPVIACALAKDKHRRFASAGALCAALRTAREGDGALGAALEPPVAPEPPEPVVRSASKTWVWAAAAIALVAAAGLAVGMLSGDRNGSARAVEPAPVADAAPEPPAIPVAIDAAAPPAPPVVDAAPRVERPRSGRTTRPRPRAKPPDAAPPRRVEPRRRDNPEDGDKTKWGDTAKPF